VTEVKRVNQAGIEFTIAQPGNASARTPAVICLHGIGGDDQSFLSQSKALSERFRVFAWNMPGYRDSLKLETVSFDQLVAALKGLIDALQLSQVHLIGQSIGGMIAQEFVYRYPKRVSSLVLIATTSAFGGKDDSFKQTFLKARLTPLDKGISMRTLAEQSIHQIVGSECSNAVKEAAITSMANVQESSYRDILECLVTFNRRNEFTQIQHPVCLISGSEDTNAPANTMKKMAAKLANSQYHEIQGAGHLVNLENGAEVNQIIDQFLSQNSTHE